MSADIKGTRLVLSVNGERRQLMIEPHRPLLDLLRDDLDLTGSKKACDDGECGSCIVLLGEKAVKSCLLPASRAEGKEVTTIEGLPARYNKNPGTQGGRPNILHPLQTAFVELGATQCGFCIPGMIVQAEALLASNPNPTRDDVVKRLSGNLCRCTGYTKIIEAVLYAGELMRGAVARNVSRDDNGHIVGKGVVRLDAMDKATGRAKYAADLKMAGMLYAKVLRSPHHHANILSIDASAARAIPGVQAVLTAADVPGKITMPSGRPQVNLFARDKVRFMGEAVAAVAAVSEEVAAEALSHIKVSYEILPAVLDPVLAGKDDAPQLHPPEKNKYLFTKVVQGDVAKGFAEADVVVESTYSTPGWEHAYMEPEAALASMDDKGCMVVHAPQHHPFTGRDFIADMLAIDRSRVRIICPAMGGNFGGRGDFEASGITALLALKTGKPVKIVYTREESLLGSSKGYGYHMKFKTGATKDGKLVAMEAELVANGGSGLLNIQRGLVDGMSWCYSHCTGPYYIPNVLVNVYEVYTNRPRSVPLRGGQGVNAALGHESQMEALAARLGLDPMELRRRNVLKVGSRTHRGQILEESVGATATLDALQGPYADAQAWATQKSSSPVWKRGVGLGCSWYAHGGSANIVKAAVELLENGKVQVLAGSVEKGQGVLTILAQIAAEELGVPMDSLVMTIGDTMLAPYRVETNAQMTTVMVGGSVQRACHALKEALLQTASEVLEEDRQKVVFRNGVAFSPRFAEEKLSLVQLANYFRQKGMPMRYEGSFAWQRYKPLDPETGHGALCDVYTYGSAVAQVEVNVETGQVRVPKVVYACDSGTVINQQAFEGQIEGGVVMGLGFALKEKFEPGTTRNFRTYGLPTTQDAPETLTVVSVGEPASMGGAFGAKGVGDMSDIAAVPAVLNGVFNATGVRICHLPATRSKLLEALG